jgi:two-component system response regulator ChvI
MARAYWNSVDVNLTVGEFKVVQLLAADIAAYVPYRQIYDAMHYVSFAAGYGEHGYRANVRSSIMRIRDKFRQVDASFDQMKNHAGFGYSWRSKEPG